MSSSAAAPRPLTLRELISANRGIFSTFTLYSAALFACTFAAYFAVRSDSVVGASLGKSCLAAASRGCAASTSAHAHGAAPSLSGTPSLLHTRSPL